jgi:peptidoglycan hydrolase-like protein with peptidoglycan-binding domain
MAPRKPRLFRSALVAAGAVTGAIAIGVLVGYLVNGPPQRPLDSRVESPLVADSSSAAPSADGVPTGTTAAPAPEAPTAPPPAAAAPAVPDPTAAAAAPPPAAAAPAAPEPSAAAAQMPTAEVREMQGRLRAMGFNPGPVDGFVGPLTENAAQQYQRARGLEVTGAVDRNLLAQLRQETPPPPPRYAAKSYASNTAVAQRRPRSPFDDFLDNLDRLFRR